MCILLNELNKHDMRIPDKPQMWPTSAQYQQEQHHHHHHQQQQQQQQQGFNNPYLAVDGTQSHEAAEHVLTDPALLDDNIDPAQTCDASNPEDFAAVARDMTPDVFMTPVVPFNSPSCIDSPMHDAGPVTNTQIMLPFNSKSGPYLPENAVIITHSHSFPGPGIASSNTRQPTTPPTTTTLKPKRKGKSPSLRKSPRSRSNSKASNRSKGSPKTYSQRKHILCITCGMLSTCMANHRTHVKCHTNNKPYGCIMCPKRFREPWPLHRHCKDVHHIWHKVPKIDGVGSRRAAGKKSYKIVEPRENDMVVEQMALPAFDSVPSLQQKKKRSPLLRPPPPCEPIARDVAAANSPNVAVLNADTADLAEHGIKTDDWTTWPLLSIQNDNFTSSPPIFTCSAEHEEVRFTHVEELQMHRHQVHGAPISTACPCAICIEIFSGRGWKGAEHLRDKQAPGPSFGTPIPHESIFPESPFLNHNSSSDSSCTLAESASPSPPVSKPSDTAHSSPDATPYPRSALCGLGHTSPRVTILTNATATHNSGATQPSREQLVQIEEILRELGEKCGRDYC